ncbi:MAG: tetratricopeptide repeat protein [Pseudomonadota bacterium]
MAMPAQAAEPVERRVAALAAEAMTLKLAGDRPAALARAEAATALAERKPGPRQATLYVALNALRETVPDQDFERQYATYARFAAVATQAKGAESYAALAATTARNLLAYVLRKPGATIAGIADPLTRAMPIAPDDVERARTAGWSMFLAQLYDSTGQHDRAVQTVATTATFFNEPPATPNWMFGTSMSVMANRYADWQDWPRAILAADRAIAASVAFHGSRRTELTSPLKARGRAYAAQGRFADAERDYREAVALADTLPNPILQSGTMLDLARFYVLTGRDALAVPILERTAERARANPPQSSTRMMALIELYNLAQRAGDDAAASRSASDARADADARGFSGSAIYVEILLSLMNIALLRQDPDAAERLLISAENLSIKTAKNNYIIGGDILIAKANLASYKSHAELAIIYIQAAIKCFEEAKSFDILKISNARMNLARQLEGLNKRKRAWEVARIGADQITKTLIMRTAQGYQERLDNQAIAILETGIDTAWATRRRKARRVAHSQY